MDEKDARSLVTKLTNAAFEAGMWHGDPSPYMEMDWKAKAEKLGDEIVRHLSSQSSGRDEAWVCSKCSQGGNKGPLCDFCKEPRRC